MFFTRMLSSSRSGLALSEQQMNSFENTVIDTSKWEDVNDVLKDKEALKLFREYLQKRLAVENLLCYEAMELYEKLKEENERKKVADFIVKQFIEDESQDVVNISFKVRDPLLKQPRVYEETTFTDAKEELKALLQNNFYLSFVESLDTGEREDAWSVSVSSSKNLSFNELSQILTKDVNGDLSFLQCGCKRPSLEGMDETERLELRPFCCERGRIKAKILKAKKKKQKYLVSNFIRTFLFRSRQKSAEKSDEKHEFKLFCMLRH